MKKVMGFIVLFLVLAACAPGAEEQFAARPMHEVFNVTINDQAVGRENGVFVYQTDAYDLHLDLGMSYLWLGVEAGVPAVGFSLVNKSSDRVLVHWDETTFIDANGSSSRVYHYGVRYADRNLSHPPTVVAPGARIDDAIVPADYTHFDREWRELPTVILATAPSTTLRVFFTLEVGDQRENLNMVFTGR